MPNRAAAGAPRALEIDDPRDRHDTGNDTNGMVLYDIPRHKYDGQVMRMDPPSLLSNAYPPDQTRAWKK